MNVFKGVKIEFEYQKFMKTSNEFFLIFLETILLVRIFLFLKPISSPNVGKFRIHHYMYGFIGILLGLVFNFLFIYAVGVGLFIDELAYLLINGKTHADNYSTISLLGTLFFIIIIYVFREKLIFFFLAF